jgi:hypothetical protein
MERSLTRPRPVATLGDLVPLAFLALLVLFVHRATVFAPRVLVGDDVLLQNLPETKLVYESLDSGRLPLWTPLALTGYPFYAEGQAGVFYPPTVALHRVVRAAERSGATPPGDPGWRLTFALELFLHHLAFVLLVYLLARHLARSRSAATLAAIAVGFGGFVTGHLIHQNLIRSLPYLPLLWLFSLRAHANGEGATARDIAFHAVALGLLFVAGHHQTAIAIGFAWVAMVGWLEHAWPSSPRRFVSRVLLRTAPPTVLALVLAAVQLVPTLELFSQSIRAQSAGWAERAAWSWTPAVWVHWIFPFLFGTGRTDLPYFGSGLFQEMISYVGLVPIALVLLTAPWRRPTPGAAFSGCVALGGLLLALGSFSPLYPVHMVPPLSLFRNPCRFTLFAELGFALLAAFALDDLRTGAAAERVERGMRRFPAGRVVLLGGVFVVAALVGYRALGGKFAGTPAPRGGYTAVVADGRQEYSAENLAKPDVRVRASLLAAVQGGLLAIVILVLARVVAGLRHAGRMTPAMCGFWLALLAAGDSVLGFASRAWSTELLQIAIAERGPVAHVRTAQVRSRMFVEAFPDRRPVSQFVRWRQHAANLYSNIPTVSGYLGPLTPRAWVEFFTDPSRPAPADFDRALGTIARLDPIKDHWKLTLAGVHWLLSATPHETDKWRSEIGEDDVTLHSNKRPAPRAYLVRSLGRAGPDAQAKLPQLNKLFNAVTLEPPDGPPLLAAQVSAPQESVTLTEAGNEEVLALAHLKAPGWLVLADMAYPGWKCFVNGQPAPIATACRMFRAVQLPGGVSDVRFSFQPDAFRNGAWATLFGLAITIMLLGVSLFGPEPTEDEVR